jgi:hypothetical protein
MRSSLTCTRYYFINATLATSYRRHYHLPLYAATQQPYRNTHALRRHSIDDYDDINGLRLKFTPLSLLRRDSRHRCYAIAAEHTS